MNEKQIRALLIASGVDNGLGHHEDGKLVTAITSYEELERLVQLVYDMAYIEGVYD
jgi:hypothetical protein